MLAIVCDEHWIFLDFTMCNHCYLYTAKATILGVKNIVQSTDLKKKVT